MRDRVIRESIGVVRRNRWEGDVEKAEKRRGGEGQEEQEDRTRQDKTGQFGREKQEGK